MGEAQLEFVTGAAEVIQGSRGAVEIGGPPALREKDDLVEGIRADEDAGG